MWSDWKYDHELLTEVTVVRDKEPTECTKLVYGRSVVVSDTVRTAVGLHIMYTASQTCRRLSYQAWLNADA